jgi:hypothetical protein
MSTEFNFLVINANQQVEAQQKLVRELMARRLNLSRFKRPECEEQAKIDTASRRVRSGAPARV